MIDSVGWHGKGGFHLKIRFGVLWAVYYEAKDECLCALIMGRDVWYFSDGDRCFFLSLM